MANVIIFGAGKIAQLAHYYFIHDSEHNVVAFMVNKEYLKGDSYLGLPLFDARDLIERYPPESYRVFVALSYTGMNTPRAQCFEYIKALGYNMVSYVSSRCISLTKHPIGENCFILESVTIQPFAKIGNNVMLWSGVTICHDTVIDDHCFIAAGSVVLGNTHVQQRCFIGANATIRNSITVSEGTLVGAGSIVMEDTRLNSVYIPQHTNHIDKHSNDIHL